MDHIFCILQAVSGYFFDFFTGERPETEPENGQDGGIFPKTSSDILI